MITLPFCLKCKYFIHIPQQHPLFLHNFINPRQVSKAFLPQFSHSFHSNSKQVSVIPTFIVAMSLCYSVLECQLIHAGVIKSANYTACFIGDRLVSAYANLGYDMDAVKLFDEMPCKDLVSWNSLISVFSQNGYIGNCFIGLSKMKSEMSVQPNEVTLISVISSCTGFRVLKEGTYIHGFALKSGMLNETKVVNSLINMYGKLGILNASCELFYSMPVRNLISWNSILMIHTQNGFSEEGIGLFNSMRRAEISPDRATMVTLLQGCSDLGIKRQAETIHTYICSSGFNSDIGIKTALLNCYSKSGKFTSSIEVFKEIETPDIIAWTAMLACYATHGFGREAIDGFHFMIKEGLQPDHVTFTHLLNACSHSGLVNEGKKYFEIMSTVYGMKPRLDHYSCMVDLLGRSGLLEEAHTLIESMPMEPNSAIWGALLGACRVYGNVQLGKKAAENLFSLDPSDHRNYVMLSNICSAAGLWSDASNVRALLKQRAIIRNAGCSFLEHRNKIYRFVVGDRSHPESEKIYKKLEEILIKIREAGFTAKTEFVLHNVDDKVKEDMINQHGEKLAIAFGLLVIGSSDSIVINKNIRICGDCHEMAKAVSQIESRNITIRDSKRFHHFANGSCSCGDFW